MSQSPENNTLSSKSPASNPAKNRQARKARRPFEFTPARRAALDRARAMRRFEMTPAKQEAQRKATEANQKNWKMTPARLAAMKINVRKMQRASVEKFRMTERRRRATLANLEKAWANPPDPQARARFNHLKHGLQVRRLEDTMELLGEDPKEFEALQEHFRRVFRPANRVEEKAVGRIAAATWRRLRLYSAQARWESDRLKRYFAEAEPVDNLDTDTTRMRGLLLIMLLTERERLHRREQSLLGVVEREIRILLRLRSGDPQFQIYARESAKELNTFRKMWRELEAQKEHIEEEQRYLRFQERLRAGDPEVEAANERLRAKWVRL